LIRVRSGEIQSIVAERYDAHARHGVEVLAPLGIAYENAVPGDEFRQLPVQLGTIDTAAARGEDRIRLIDHGAPPIERTLAARHSTSRRPHLSHELLRCPLLTSYTIS
jgi:hypothetical protein